MVKERLANSDLADKDLDRFIYAKLLNNTYKNFIVKAKSSVFGKLPIMVKSAREADTILTDKFLKSMGLRASISSYFVTCKGAIGRILIKLSEKQINDNLVTFNSTQMTKTVLTQEAVTPCS